MLHIEEISKQTACSDGVAQCQGKRVAQPSSVRMNLVPHG
jgi:hypothetical protein